MLTLQVKVLAHVEGTDGGAQVAVGKVDALLPASWYRLRSVLVAVVVLEDVLEAQVEVLDAVHHEAPEEVVLDGAKVVRGKMRLSYLGDFLVGTYVSEVTVTISCTSRK